MHPVVVGSLSTPGSDLAYPLRWGMVIRSVGFDTGMVVGFRTDNNRKILLVDTGKEVKFVHIEGRMFTILSW